MIVLWVFIGFIIGGSCGVGAMALLFAARDTDYEEGKYDDE